MSKQLDLQDNQMIEISVSDFIYGLDLVVDVFVRLAANKYVRVAKAGDKAQIESLTTFKKAKLESLFVKKTEYDLLVIKNVSIAGIVMAREEIGVEQKAIFLRNALASVYKQLDCLGPNKEAYNHAKKIIESTLTLVETKVGIRELLAQLQKSSSSMLDFSIAVSLFSVMIAKSMGWTSKTTLEKLALGGMLAEIGLRELPTELIEKPRAEMSYDETVLYETHPFRGMKILQSIGIVPDDICSIACEHHENAIGQGYPRRLRDLRMNPLAKIVALATQFCELAIKTSSNKHPKDVFESYQHIVHVMGQPYNKQALLGLRDLINSEQIN